CGGDAEQLQLRSCEILCGHGSGLLARGRRGRTARSQVAQIRLMLENRDRARQTKFNQKVPCRTTPVATGAVNLARWWQDSAHGWVICASAQILVALRHQTIGADGCSSASGKSRAGPGVPCSFIDLLTPGSTGIILKF